MFWLRDFRTGACRRIIRQIALGATLVCGPIAAQLSGGADYYPPPESEGGWRSIVPPNGTPSDVQKREILARAGLDWDRLQHAWDYDMTTVGPDSRKSLLIIRNGWIAFERYYSPKGDYTADTRSRFASGTKTLVGVSLARLFFQGKCKDTDHLYRYMPASWAASEPARKNIQIRHVLTMSSGLEPYDGPYDPADYGEIISNLGVIARPGSLWFYNTGALDLLNYVILNRSGKTMDEFLNSEVMDAIDGGRVDVQARYRFNGHGFCSFYEITPRDYARIGYLFLNRGQWKDKALIAANIVARMTTNPRWLANASTGTSYGNGAGDNQAYAYTFWLNTDSRLPGLPTGAYMASGGNHKMIVVPELDMVIVRVGNYAHDSDTVSRVYSLISSAVTDLPQDRTLSARGPLRKRPAPAAAPPAVPITKFKKVPSGKHLLMEAESGVCTPPMSVASESGNVKYAWAPRSHPANYDTPGGPARLSLGFHLPEGGLYDIWIRTIAPGPHSDSYFLSLDGTIIDQPWHTLAIPQSTDWQWRKIRSGRMIEAGNHALEFRHRESGIKLDKVLITADRSFSPQLEGH
jgi:CubicO group peptidase (beta-lactamase class C family)